MNIDPTTSTVIEKREHTCLNFSDFRHRFRKPKSYYAKNLYTIFTRPELSSKRRRRGLHATHSNVPTCLDGADGTDERPSAASSRGDGGTFFCLLPADA
jgi:hypothetical protein